MTEETFTLPDGYALELLHSGHFVRWLLTKDDDAFVYYESTKVSLLLRTEDFLEEVTSSRKTMIFAALTINKNLKAVDEL